jgi:hypothetical protein
MSTQISLERNPHKTPHSQPWETKRVRDKFSVRGPIFRRAKTTSWGGIDRLHFRVRRPLILRLHDKNQEYRAQKMGPRARI